MTKKDLEKLPQEAMVAFAARCARRVQPLFKGLWPYVTEEHASAVNGAIDAAENATGSDDPTRANRAAEAAKAEVNYVAFHVACAAARAADAAENAEISGHTVAALDSYGAAVPHAFAEQLTQKATVVACRIGALCPVDVVDSIHLVHCAGSAQRPLVSSAPVDSQDVIRVEPRMAKHNKTPSHRTPRGEIPPARRPMRSGLITT